MEATVKELSREARALIDTVGSADGPSADDRERIRGALFGAVAAGATVAGSSGSAFAAHGAVPLAAAVVKTEVAAGAGLAALTGKGSTAVLLWFVAGGAAGTAIATPVAFYTRQPDPSVVAPATRATEQAGVHREAHEHPAPPATNEGSGAALSEAPGEGATSAGDKAGRHSIEPSVLASKNPKAPPGQSEPQPQAAPVPSLATEVQLLKQAQRELASENPAASLALLDDHARLHPEGALKAERLAARVFALCKLGRIEQARATAREFLSIAGSSPLVPRVLASCGGTTGETQKPR
jgi:hypothetical protein